MITSRMQVLLDLYHPLATGRRPATAFQCPQLFDGRTIRGASNSGE